MENVKPVNSDRQESWDELRERLDREVARTLEFCIRCNSRFVAFEREFMTHLYRIAQVFIALFLTARQQRCDTERCHHKGYWRNPDLVSRVIDTAYGPVRYWRSYWAARLKGKGGFHPLDAELGLTRDGFSPGVIFLACRLCAYLSYEKATTIFKAFLGWCPSTETLEQWVAGLGREARPFMDVPPVFEKPDGEVLIIEVDGKAVPTATVEELDKRRESQRRCGGHCEGEKCKCQRHRGRAARKRRGSKKRKKKNDKRKNGRSATVVVMYTLTRGDDGRLHGPLNKRVFASFAPRRAMVEWAKAEAARRGFGPGCGKMIQVVVDGEVCLAKRLKKAFPTARMTLDIRHVEERLWKAGRAFHPESSDALTAWVTQLRDVLYARGGRALIKVLNTMLTTVSGQHHGRSKVQALESVLKYLTPRRAMLQYHVLRREDMVIASGVVEGAVRYVVGERLDCSGMRWVAGKAECILHLRCIEVNGEWERFQNWVCQRLAKRLESRETVVVRSDKPLPLTAAA